MDRRRFLRQAGTAGVVAAAAFRTDGLARVLAAGRDTAGADPSALAADEAFWREIQSAFTLDRTIINLNNGGVCPSPRVVHEALKRYLDISNQAPVYHMWQVLEPNIESVRRALAAEAGCEVEELAITRNASEALQIAQLGIDLAPGDEVLTTNQDYGRMLDTWEQRVRRDRIVLNKISFPVPPPSQADLVSRIEKAITPRTKVIHVCHITNLTGQIFPVRDICRMARAKGITTIVDGAHAFAHFPFTLADLECDYYGTSLHKWLLAPVGTGFLYVRRARVKDHWPLTPANESRAGDIRKFEEIGTHPAAMHNAIAEALEFHHALGGPRKAARLRYLRDRWARELHQRPGAKVLSSFDPAQGCAIGLLSLDGFDPEKVTAHLWNRHRIIVTPIRHPEFQGLRITPNLYTTLNEVDTFVAAIDDVLKRGTAS
ncbi:MAG TPA: aminotransferase class V-fold PLP-dependent enzyme [Vicinamibacterales bacterium]